MLRRTGRALVIAAALSLFCAAGAEAIDAPRWVAALHIAAQKANGLRWNPVPGASGYKVLRSTTAGSGYAEIGGGPQPQLIDSNLEPGTTYYYVLQALAGAEVSPNSEEKSVTVPGEKKVEAMKPPAMRDLTLTQTTEFGKTVSKVGIFWTAPAGSAIAYNVYRSTTAGKDYQMLSSTSEPQYVDATVEIGKTYYYTVTALDQAFQETPMSPEKAVEIKEPEKKVAAKREEKIKLLIRQSKLVRDIRGGSWGKLEQPTAVVVSSTGEIYVADPVPNKVYVFDPAGEFLFAFGETGLEDGQIKSPLDMAIDADDNLWISMSGGRIEIFDSKGQPQRTIRAKDIIPDAGGFGGVAVGPDNWYLTDDVHHRVYTMDNSTFKEVSRIGELGKELGQFRSPKKLFFSKKENALVVADTFNFRMQVLRDGKADVAFGTYGNSVTQFNRVLAAAEDDLGNILTVDFGNHTAQAFDYKGDFKYVVGNEDGTEQIPMAGSPAVFVVKNRAYLVNKLLGSVMIWEMSDRILPIVAKKK